MNHMGVARRSFLLGGASAAALLAGGEAARAWRLGRLGGGMGSGGGGGATIAAVTVNNFGGSAMAAGTPVRFAHVFADGDLPSGTALQITDGAGNPVPFTAARRSRGLNGQLICVDLLCQTAQSIAPNGSDTFTLKSVGGSFNDSLPGGRTVAQVVSDITANFSNIKVQLSGLNYNGTTEGSGTWQANSTAGFNAGTTAASTGYYRIVATGPAAADFIVYQPLADVSGGAQHPTLWAAFYVTAFLNTTTGAVQKLCWQVWVNQGLYNAASKSYRCQIALYLNSTLVRGWGGNAGDGRTFTFAPSAVSGSAISLPGNTFVPGQLVQFTGTPPTGLSTGTDYYVSPTSHALGGASTIYVYSSQGASDCPNGSRSAAYSVPSDYIAIGAPASGTCTVQGYTQFGYYSMNCLADADGGWDWHQDNSGALGGKPTLWPVQDINYYHGSRKTVPIDLTQNLAISSDTTPSTWAPMCLGGVSNAPNTGGAHQEYGAPWNEYACRRFRYPGDRTGYVQTHRVGTLAHAAWSMYLFDHANFRIFAGNGSPRGPYAGINQIPGVDLFSANGAPPAPQGSQGVIPTNETSHWWTFSYGCYLFEGGQPLLDLIIAQAHAMVMHSFENAGYASLSRNQMTAAGTYWTVIQHAGGDPRQNAWQFLQLVDGWVVAPSEGPEANYPEKQYFKDMIDDSASFLAFCRSSSGFGANFAALGGWLTETTNNGPPNVSNVLNAGTASSLDTVTVTAFQQFYMASAWIYSYMRCPTSGMLTVARHMGNYVANWWAGNCPHFSNAYNHQVKEAPGWAAGATTNNNFVSLSDLGIQPQAADGVAFGEDGKTCYLLTDLGGNGAQYVIQPQNGDRIFFWDGYDVTVQAGGWDLPPSGVSPFAWYYMHNVQTIPGLVGGTAISTFTLSTTDPTDTPVTWTGSATQTTLASAITASATAISLASAATTSQGQYSPKIVKIDSEYLNVATASAVAALTAQASGGIPSSNGAIPARGNYGSTAASHNAGAPVVVYRNISNFMIEVIGRTTGCPAATSLFGNGGGVPFGYVTGWRQAAGIASWAGIIGTAAFNNADALFQAYSDPPINDEGPAGFAAQSALMLSFNPSP